MSGLTITFSNDLSKRLGEVKSLYKKTYNQILVKELNEIFNTNDVLQKSLSENGYNGIGSIEWDTYQEWDDGDGTTTSINGLLVQDKNGDEIDDSVEMKVEYGYKEGFYNVDIYDFLRDYLYRHDIDELSDLTGDFIDLKIGDGEYE